ncbi:hypothetical protein [Lebetimonas sp. JH292]|nr:hypothetical protein [Lebetimonas sp. JH292]
MEFGCRVGGSTCVAVVEKGMECLNEPSEKKLKTLSLIGVSVILKRRAR